MKNKHILTAVCALTIAAVIYMAASIGEIPADVQESVVFNSSPENISTVESAETPKDSEDSQSNKFDTSPPASAPDNIGQTSPATLPPASTAGDSVEPVKEEIAAFAAQIKEAFSKEDLKALAELCGYPVYISMAGDGGLELNTDVELLTLDPDQIFTDGLKESIADADSDNLEIYGAGIIIGDEQSIVFNKIDGLMMITGIHP